MNTPELIVEIDQETGNITMEAMNYKGGKCVIDVSDLSSLLGLSKVSDKVKPEYARVVPVQRIKR
jgi:DUF917 family protein